MSGVPKFTQEEFNQLYVLHKGINELKAAWGRDKFYAIAQEIHRRDAQLKAAADE